METEIKLTEKQKKFCDYYIETGNATKAAIQAGYKEKAAYKTGSENLKKAQIKAYIDKMLSSKDKKRIASQDEILSYLTSVMRGESIADVVVVEGLGEGISKAKSFSKNPDEKERLKAAEMLAKRYGLDKPIDVETEDKGVEIKWE